MAENEKVTKTAADKKTAKAGSEKKPSVFKRMAAWFRSVKAELKKIVWTSAKTVRTNTIMVLVAMLIFAALTGLLDFVFNKFIDALAELI